MRKLVFHFAIAFSTFVVSTGLSSIWASLVGRAEVPVQKVQHSLSVADWRVAAVDPGLMEIYGEYAAAQTRHDREFFENVETEDFVLFLRGGQTLSRTADIELLNSDTSGTVYELDDLKAEMYGSTAVVTGRMTASSSGYNHSWRWLDVCVRRGGRWQIQSTTQLD